MSQPSNITFTFLDLPLNPEPHPVLAFHPIHFVLAFHPIHFVLALGLCSSLPSTLPELRIITHTDIDSSRTLSTHPTAGAFIKHLVNPTYLNPATTKIQQLPKSSHADT
tara:strand:- start:1395 stop:1721 length:327 start_codon:yes stop_codon:yes gene_type:complete